ncbi:MAG: hypothetical protein SNJ83_10680 [Aggregatilineales bacterium]
MVWTASYTIEDAKGKASTLEVNFETAVTFDNARRAAQRIAQLINPLIGGAIRKINITYSVGLPSGLRTTPETNSDVEEGARFQFLTENGFYTGMRVPTFSEAALVANSTEVDQTNTNVQAFVNALVSGVALTDPAALVPCVDKRNEDITSLSFAREQFQSSRR